MIKQLFFGISILFTCLAAAPAMTYAASYTPYGNTVCSTSVEKKSSAVCIDKGDGKTNPLTGCSSDGTTGCGTGILSKITNLMAYIAGTAAIILLVVGAIRYITSGSDVSVGSRIDDDVLNAKRTIVNALVGLAIIVLAKVIINYAVKNIH